MKGGLLAGSPSHFSLPMLSKVQPFGVESRARRVPYTMTHKGLAIKAFLQAEEEYNVNVPDKHFKMALNCCLSKQEQPLPIWLVRVGPFSFERVLGPGAEMICEWDRDSFNEVKYRSHRTQQLDEENLICIPQSPYPELLEAGCTQCSDLCML